MIVDDLKKAILDYAIQGKLTKQKEKDVSAFALKEKLLETRIKFTNEKKILKKPFLNNDDIVPKFPIPHNWTWAYLSNVSIIQEGAGIRKHQYKAKGIQLLSVTNILDGEVDLEKKQLYVSKEEYQKRYSHLRLNQGDIVTACSGGSWGKVAIYNEPDEVMLNTSTLRMRFFEDLGNNKYLYYVVKSEYFKKCLAEQLSGIQPNFGYAHYSTIPIPLPPLEEQQRIVNKVEDLMNKLDEIKPIEDELNIEKKLFSVNMKKSILADLYKDAKNVDKIELGKIISLENVKNVSKGSYNYLDVKYLRNLEYGKKLEQGRFVQKGDLVLLMDGENSGELFKIPEDGYLGSTLKKISINSDIMEEYLIYFLQLKQDYFKKNKRGAAIPHLDKKLFNEAKIYLPKMEEQQKIVNKLEQLLSLCSDIENIVS